MKSLDPSSSLVVVVHVDTSEVKEGVTDAVCRCEGWRCECVLTECPDPSSPELCFEWVVEAGLSRLTEL